VSVTPIKKYLHGMKPRSAARMDSPSCSRFFFRPEPGCRLAPDSNNFDEIDDPFHDDLRKIERQVSTQADPWCGLPTPPKQ